MTTPVLLIVFNRPDLTEKVFNRIAKAKPEQLFLVADGPREGNESDKKACAEVKKIVENVTWECEVYCNYSERNLGCGIRVASGISWVFDQVDRAIILEDDCLPDPSFFSFCDELLERYIDDERVMTISGKNLQTEHTQTNNSYYFSRYPVTWGWATWHRAWKHYDYHVGLWGELKETEFPREITRYENTAKYLRHHFEKSYRSNPPRDIHDSDYTYTWDYQWVFNCWVQQGLTIVPDRNLISNIGFGENATHTMKEDHEYASMPVTRMEFPLIHPSHRLVNNKADNHHFEKMSSNLNNIRTKRPNYFLKSKNKIIRLLRSLKILSPVFYKDLKI